MGTDWGEIPKGGKPRWWLILLLILALVVIFAKWHPSETRIPRSVTSPDWPKQAVSSPVQATPGPVSRPERKPEKPTSSVLTIYVVSTVNDKFWGVSAAIAGWKSAKYTDFKLAKRCPIAAPCIKVTTYKYLDFKVAAQAEFGYRMQDLFIKVNPIITSHKEAQSALAHEFGHVIGAPHIVGTHNTVMNPIGIYRLLPSKTDVQTVDRLGRWQLEKMYESSGKTLDVRTVPN